MFSYGEFLLWNNEAITIEKNMLFWKSWFKRNTLFVQDILNADGNFLTLEEFQNKFNIETNYLHYFQLMAAIPSDFFKKKKARDSEVPSKQLLSNSTVSLSPESTPIIQVSKPGKLNLPTLLQNGKPNSLSFINQQEIIN